MTETLSRHWSKIQTNLFPHLQECLDPLTEKHYRLVYIIEFASVEHYIQVPYYRGPGRPRSDEVAMFNAFLAKSLYNIPQTNHLIEMLKIDSNLRRICGWDQKSQIPSESVFSRRFSDFAESGLAHKIHAEFIKKYHGERIVGHVSRDSTAIEVREKVVKQEQSKAPIVAEKNKRGRPKKGEEKPMPEPTRIERQLDMTLSEMLVDLPKDCGIGCKKNAKGFKESWKGYKLHTDTIDGDIPASIILTSASVHDSQVDIPLATMTEKKITYLYELKDSAYDGVIARQRAADNNHVAIVDFNRRSPKDTRQFEAFEKERFKNRSSAERLNSNLKDNYGCRLIRVRGHAKVMTHLALGIICIAIEQTLRLLL
jgi:transposase